MRERQQLEGAQASSQLTPANAVLESDRIKGWKAMKK